MNRICRCILFSTVPGISILLFVLVTLTGCGSTTDPDRPKTVPVRGTITHNGQSLAGASVTFLHRDGQRSAVGRTDSNGRYSLTTFEPGDGAIPGEYGVQVVKYEEPESPPEDGETPPLKSLVPEKYTTVANSGLTATVAEGAGNTFDFDLQ